MSRTVCRDPRRPGCCAGAVALPGAGLAAAILLLASCAGLPRSRTEVFLEGQHLSPGPWTVSAVSVDHRTAESQVRAMLADLLLPVSRARGIPLADATQGDYLLELRLVERELARDLDIVNAMSVTVTIREASTGKRAATAVYSEESSRSLASSYHLHAVLDRLMKALAQELRRRERSRKVPAA